MIKPSCGQSSALSSSQISSVVWILMAVNHAVKPGKGVCFYVNDAFAWFELN